MGAEIIRILVDGRLINPKLSIFKGLREGNFHSSKSKEHEMSLNREGPKMKIHPAVLIRQK